MLQELIRIAWVGLNKRTNTVYMRIEVSTYLSHRPIQSHLLYQLLIHHHHPLQASSAVVIA